MTAIMTGTCTEDQFWAEVAHIGWGTKTTDNKAISNELLERWDGEFFESFDEHYRKAHRALYHRITAFENRTGQSCYLGDDGFGDLISHIIGLGKDEYTVTMENPQRAVDRAHKFDFVECFSYCLHLDFPREDLTEDEALERAKNNFFGEEPEGDVVFEDYDEDIELHLQMEALRIRLGSKAEKDPRYFALWAKRQLPELEALAETPYSLQLPELSKVILVLRKISDGDITSVTPKMQKAVEDLQEKRSKLYQKALSELEVLSPGGCGLENLVGDILKSK